LLGLEPIGVSPPRLGALPGPGAEVSCTLDPHGLIDQRADRITQTIEAFLEDHLNAYELQRPGHRSEIRRRNRYRQVRQGTSALGSCGIDLLRTSYEGVFKASVNYLPIALSVKQ
jgi:hypothetical protein